MLAYLQYGPRHLSAFAARKSCHMLSGACMILIGSEEPICRYFVYAVTVVSLAMTWEVFPRALPPLWFGAAKDVGITVYLLVVCLWFYMQLPVSVLAPIFFADPAGAIVGRYMSRKYAKMNLKWIGDKTIFGSLAVFIVTFFTASVDNQNRYYVALASTIGEAIGGKYDNLVVAVIAIGAWFFN